MRDAGVDPGFSQGRANMIEVQERGGCGRGKGVGEGRVWERVHAWILLRNI